MNNYTNLLREHNLKVTPQRLTIIKTIQEYGHINIDILYEKIKLQFETISLATIYKNISQMKDKYLLNEVKLPNEKTVYEIIKEKHSHLLCNRCNIVIDIDIQLDTITDKISSKYNFSIEQSDLVISGVCDKCKGDL